MALLRVTGTVTHTEYRNGDFDGKPWSFWEAVLLVGFETVRIRLADNVRTPENGDHVDYCVEVQPGLGNGIKIKAVRAWAEVDSTQAA